MFRKCVHVVFHVRLKHVARQHRIKRDRRKHYAVSAQHKAVVLQVLSDLAHFRVFCKGLNSRYHIVYRQTVEVLFIAAEHRCGCGIGTIIYIDVVGLAFLLA